MKVQNYYKWVAIIPYTLIKELLTILLPQSNVSLDVFFVGMTFGPEQQRSLSAFAPSIENLGHLFLFLILYGDYVSSFYKDGAAYYFCRIKSYFWWSIKLFKRFISFAFLYSIAFSTTNLIIAMMKTSCRIECIDYVIYTFVSFTIYTIQVIVLLLLFQTIMQFITHSTAVGIFIALALLCGLVILTLLPISDFWNYINPLFMHITFSNSTPEKVLFQESIALLEIFSLTSILTRLIVNTDISSAISD